MSENIENDNLDELLDQLKNDTTLNHTITSNKIELNLNDENINDYVLQKAGKLVENGVDTVDALRESVLAGCEPDQIGAYSELFRAVTGALDSLNRINIQNKKDKTAKEIKVMDVDARNQLPSGHTGGDTNILIAPREEIIKKFLEQHKEAINVDFEEKDGLENEE